MSSTPRVELIGRWDHYWKRHADLVRARRSVRADRSTRGRRNWTRARVETHAREVCT